MSTFIVAAKRTPFGSFGGKLKHLSATDLGVLAAKATVSSAGVDPAAVNECIFGNVAQTSADAAYLARHVGLRTGMRHDSTGLTVNRLCGSGFQAAISGAHAIQAGEADLVLAGGSESMSQAPMSLYGHQIRFGTKLGSPPPFTDTLWSALTDSYANTPMGMTAEKLAEQYGIGRAESDAFALKSQHNYASALAAGLYENELAPVEIPASKGKAKGKAAASAAGGIAAGKATKPAPSPGQEWMDEDEHPRPETTLEGLGKLPPVFKKNGGTVTAGTASGISDGAGALLLASERAIKQHNLRPMTRMVAWAVAGCDPTIMGIGPVYAIRKMLQNPAQWPRGLKLSDIKHVEFNEAFAPQVLAVIKELQADGLDVASVNPHGGAITVGHPLGASGARILGHLTHSLVASGARYGIGAACIGGGQGIAVLLENMHAKH